MRNFPDTNIAAKTPYFFYFSAFSQAKASNSSKYPPAFSVFLHSFPRFIFPPHHPPFTHHSLIHCRHAHISSTLTAPPSSSPLTHASPIPLNTPPTFSRYPLTHHTPCFSLRAAKPGLFSPSSFSFHTSHTASFIRCPAYALFLRVNRSFFRSPPLMHAPSFHSLNTPYLLSRYSPLTSRTPCFSLRAAKPGLSFPSPFSFDTTGQNFSLVPYTQFSNKFQRTTLKIIFFA